MTMTILSASELAAKGITKSDVSGMLRRAEKLCNWFAKKHRSLGVTEQEQREWEIACERWDHLKATMQVLN